MKLLYIVTADTNKKIKIIFRNPTTSQELTDAVDNL